MDAQLDHQAAELDRLHEDLRQLRSPPSAPIPRLVEPLVAPPPEWSPPVAPPELPAGPPIVPPVIAASAAPPRPKSEDALEDITLAPFQAPPEPPPLLPPVPALPAVPPRPAINWEMFMGVKLFAWIGGLALFLGVAFFV